MGMLRHPGKKLKELRHSKGWSLIELAERAAVAKSSISRIENGDAVGRSQTLERLAQVLGVPVHAFYLDDESGLTIEHLGFSPVPIDGVLLPNGWLEGQTLQQLCMSKFKMGESSPVEAGQMVAQVDASFAVRSRLTAWNIDFGCAPEGLKAGLATAVVSIALEDVIAFVVHEGECPTERLVAVEMGDHVELRYVRRDLGGRYTLYPLVDVDHEPLRLGWRVVAVAVEQRRLLTSFP